MRMEWLRLKTAVVCLFGALLGGGAVFSAFKGLSVGQVFCLVCRRGAPAVPWRHAPGLFLLNELMLLGLGVACLVGVWFGLRRLITATTPEALEPPIPARRPPRPGSLHARANTLGRWLVLTLGWLLLAGAAFLGMASRDTSAVGGSGAGVLMLVAGGLAFWGGVLLIAAGRGWGRTVGVLAVGGVVMLLLLGSWLGSAAGQG